MNVLIFLLIIVLIGLFIGAFVSGLNKPHNNKNRRLLSSDRVDKEYTCNYPKQGYKRISIEAFQDKHKLIPEKLFDELIEWTLDGIEFVYIQSLIYHQSVNASNANKHDNWALNTYSELINLAKFSEKGDDIEKSIALYENAFEFAKKNSLRIHNYAHCIDRLLVLYRKIKDRESEINLLNYAIETHSDFNNATYDKWNERLAKLV